MDVLNTFIEQASNIWWGILAAIAVTAILYFIIFSLQGGSKSINPLSLVFAIPLFVLLSIQFYLLFGSISLKHTCNKASTWIDAIVPEHSVDGSFSREDVNEAVHQLVTTFPLASTFIDADDISLDKDNTLGEALTNKVQTYLNWYIVRRIAWSIAFIVLATIGIIIIKPKMPSFHHKVHREYRKRQYPTRRNRH